MRGPAEAVEGALVLESLRPEEMVLIIVVVPLITKLEYEGGI